jgi:hypothetical protein
MSYTQQLGNSNKSDLTHQPDYQSQQAGSSHVCVEG